MHNRSRITTATRVTTEFFVAVLAGIMESTARKEKENVKTNCLSNLCEVTDSIILSDIYTECIFLNSDTHNC